MISSHDLNGKWQHRLFKVIVIASTIVIGIFAFALVALNNSTWIKYSITAFDFESNFTEAKGNVVSCQTDSQFSNVSCGGSPVNDDDVVQKFNETIRTYVGQSVIQQVCTDARNERPTSLLSGLTTKDIACLDLETNGRPISETDFLTGQSTVVSGELVPDYYLNSAQTIFIRKANLNLEIALKAKQVQGIIYPVLLKDLLYAALAIAGWYIFWQVIFYRTLLYIIYGKRR